MNQVFKNEHFLVQRLKQRDESALSYTYDHYAAALLGAIFQIVKKKSTGEELLQDVFLKIWDKIDQYDSDKGRFFTWMLRIARNSALDHLKTRQSRQEAVTSELSMVQSEVDRGNQTYTSINAIGLDTLLKGLDDDDQIVINKLYLSGYSQSEAAKELEIPLGTVKTRARKAMNQLRAKLGIQ